MQIIDLLNKIANGEEVPTTIKYQDNYYNLIRKYNENWEEYEFGYKNLNGGYLNIWRDNVLNDEVEILEEEKEIPEKHINNYGDLIILGQQDNWLEPTIETDQKINAQLNPYVFEAINENFKDIENKIYEIIDYLKSKGE